jgi:protein-tyrosine phosphatase
MAQALLARRLAAVGQPARVCSAGTLGFQGTLGSRGTLCSGGALRSGDVLGEGQAPLPEVVTAMAGHGLDVSAHRSRRVTPADLCRADLILTMTRENLRHAVVMAPAAWPRAFTLRELVRRGATIGLRRPGETLPDWLARAHDGRRRPALLGDCAGDDVADPVGRPRSCYAETAAILSRLVDELAGLCWTAAGAGNACGPGSRP